MSCFSSLSDKTEVFLGDENSLSLTFNARNEGEGGAYEAELYVVLPPEADYSGIARNNVVRRCRCNNIPLFLYTWISTSLQCDTWSVQHPNYLPFLCPFQSLAQLTCSYEAENQTRYLICDLGNPMKSGTSVRAKGTPTCCSWRFPCLSTIKSSQTVPACNSSTNSKCFYGLRLLNVWYKRNKQQM